MAPGTTARDDRERVGVGRAGAGHPPEPPPAGLWTWITTVDHKRIGILYGVSAFAFFVIGGLEALLLRLQLARPDNHVVGAETFNALFTMHGTTRVLLAVTPAGGPVVHCMGA